MNANEIDNLSSISVTRNVTSGIYMPIFHAHSSYEFLFIPVKCHIAFSNTGGSIESEGRCLCFHNAHVMHKNNVPDGENYDRYVMSVGVDALKGFGKCGDLGRFSKDGTTVVQLDDIMVSRLERYFSEIRSPGASEEKKKLLTALFITEINEYMNESNTVSINQIQTYIRDVVEYIGNNYMNKITTPELADIFYVSVNKLNRDFKRYTGTTIKHHLIEIRMRYAMALLAGGEGVSKTAEQCGFDSLSYFIQSFKACTGKTPSNFSKHNLGQFEYIR